MVVNLCLPQFRTTVQCNKLCADGYDVTNLMSADAAVRRRGFKLEYFLRPPLQVTLKFGFQVELCRVDMELWPWGMDRGQGRIRMEISTSSDRLPSENSAAQEKQQLQMKGKNPNELSREKQPEQGRTCCPTSGHQWSLQAQQWGKKAVDDPQQSGRVSACRSNTESTSPEPEFKLVGRCELSEETRVCFTRSNFRPRPPFSSWPPPLPADCREEEFWNRGLISLGAVTQLRVTVPFASAATALGLKALVVWGQPARCCPAEEVERIKAIHQESERRLPRPVLVAVKPPLQPETPQSNFSIPEEFLDPITQEVMMLPMLLPSGVSVDSRTLEEHQKREATWGRAPNDPFTGVPFTSTSQPLPNPHLKSRIDQFLLHSGMTQRDGMLGRKGKGDDPQASRLLASKVDGESQNSTNSSVTQFYAESVSTNRTTQIENTEKKHSPGRGSHTQIGHSLSTDVTSELERAKKRDLTRISEESATTDKELLPQRKRPRNEAAISSYSSHEQRLSASLDEALLSALQGRPSFTSNLSQQGASNPDAETLNTSQTTDTPNTQTGGKTCSACSCSVSVYTKSTSSPIYRLTCGHLLCHNCLRGGTRPLNSVAPSTANCISCPACKSSVPRSDIVRVHH